MLTEEQYVRQQISLGRRIHLHDGVWWEEAYPSYCKPAWQFKSLEKGSVRPSKWRSLLGFSHEVDDAKHGNRVLPLMVIDGERLRSFSIETMSLKKRPKVRKGLKSCGIVSLEDLSDALLERIREINIAQAERQQTRAGAETPVRRYIKEVDSWRRQIRREFSLENRDWLGAFVDGRLVAYLRTFQVGDTRVVQQTKIDPAFYKFYPMDALYFSLLSRSAGSSSCRRVINGSPIHQSLNHYKEQFLFEAVEVPWYSSSARLVEGSKRLLRLIRRFRCKGWEPEGRNEF